MKGPTLYESNFRASILRMAREESGLSQSAMRTLLTLVELNRATTTARSASLRTLFLYDKKLLAAAWAEVMTSRYDKPTYADGQGYSRVGSLLSGVCGTNHTA